MLITLFATLAIYACGKKGDGGDSGEKVREIAIGGDLAMNRAVSRVKPAQTNPMLLYNKLKEYNNSINGSCPLGGGYATGGDLTDNDLDGVYRGGYFVYSDCIVQIPNEYAIPVYVYVDGNFIGLDGPNDNNPYIYKAVLFDLFFLIYVQDPSTDNGYFFADYYEFDTLTASGQASGISLDEEVEEDIGWGVDTSAGGGGDVVLCEYMGQDIDTLGATYKPDDNQFNPNADEDANYKVTGSYNYVYEDYQLGNGCDDTKQQDSIGASIDINPGGSGTDLHDDADCKYDPSNGGDEGTKEFNSGKARLKNKVSGAITEISYGSNCKSSFSGAGVYGYIPNFGPRGGILGMERFINHQLKTLTAQKLFSNQTATINIQSKFLQIKNKVQKKHLEFQTKLQAIKSLY
ncbi:MAG: hypothetical protein N2504_01185 [candidate division WOR-3 bacterium]|nr:hypothetical protein [candidate division WOR-3 bacterium]MCX7947185.1 hypothetical protein [candidate division WOR-3 bacterium]MDW8150241.1 hypothetical protein [candidate division WOR-3 bacterium]